MKLVYTIVVDPNPSAPAKKSAHESYNIDAMDVDSLFIKFSKGIGG